MASRWLQEKRTKLRNQIRKLPKHWPTQGVSPTKTAAHAIFQNRARVRTVVGRQDQMLPMKNNSFMEPLPIQEGHYRPDPTIQPDTFISDFRVFTLMQCDWVTRVREFKRGRLLGNWKGKWTSLYFDGAQHIVVEQGKGYIAMSAIYGSAERAVQAWEADTVCWAHVEKFDPSMQTKE